MKHIITVCAGAVWGAVALAVAAFFGLQWNDAVEIGPACMVAGVATSYCVTYLFSRHLAAPHAEKKYWLPFATIPSGVGIWATLMFLAAAVHSWLVGRHDYFDGYWMVLTVGLWVSLIVALPVTYPLAYITQVVVSRYRTVGKA